MRIATKCSGSGYADYDAVNKRFISQKLQQTFTFTILTDVEYTKTDKSDKYVKIRYHIFYSADFLKSMKVFEYHEEDLVFPGYENFKFKILISKCDEKLAKIIVKNPHKIEIGNMNQNRSSMKGKKEDYETPAFMDGNFDLNLFFVFPKKIPFKNETSDAKKINPLESLEYKTQNFHEILSNAKYFDVILTSSDGMKLKTHRCILSKFSEIFDKIFEGTQESPVKIHIDNYDFSTTNAALDFCYGKMDAIQGNAETLLKFANDFAIKELKDACCYYCSKEVDPGNVCELINIAYSQNFEELKEQCKKIMVERKAEIDKEKLKILSKDILLDVYF